MSSIGRTDGGSTIMTATQAGSTPSEEDISSIAILQGGLIATMAKAFPDVGRRLLEDVIIHIVTAVDEIVERIESIEQKQSS